MTTIASPRPRVVLVDGSSYLFRAYHALPPLTNRAGDPTGAIYGVINMLRRLLKDEQPEYLGVVFDAPGPNFRHHLYPAYKANRTEMPEDLAKQIAPLHTTIEAMGLPLICHSGVEADDVIGSMAMHMVAEGYDVLISTGDKDFTQLVGPHITLTDTMRGERLDREGVIRKFGLPPERIVDYLTLIGDAVDNVPGIPQVGPKTALKWLEAYGDLDNIIAHASEISGKVGESFRAHMDKIPLYRALVTIQQHLDIGMGPASLQLQPPDRTTLHALFETFEFRGWLKALETDHVPPPAAATTYDLVLDLPTLEAFIDQIRVQKIVAIDTETTSLDYMVARCVGVSMALRSHAAIYVPCGHTYIGAPTQLSFDTVMEKLRPILEDPTIIKIGHHLKYDQHVFLNAGICMQGFCFDTMLESYLFNSVGTLQNLASVAQTYLGVTVTPYEAVAGKGSKQISFDQVALEPACAYAASDADIAWRLHETLWPQLPDKAKKLYEDLEAPLIGVLLRMERLGVRIDVAEMQAQSQSLAQDMEILQDQAYAIAGEVFNLDSPKQLQAILYEKLAIPVRQKTPTGQPSTAEPVLAELAEEYPLPAVILRYRSLSKLKSTYTDKLPELVSPSTHRIHTSYHQAVVATGRLSSSDPNLQNIPVRTAEGRRIRKAFIAETGYQIVSADYSQIELRIMAHLSQDPGLIQAFHDKQDIHTFTASEVFEVPVGSVTSDQRRKAKAINFGLIYGMSAFGLAKQLNIEREEANAYIAQYFTRYPCVKTYMEQTRQLAATQGYVETLRGRRLYLPDIHAKGPQRQAAERAAINAPMQGTAADIIKAAMIRIDREMAAQRENCRMLMQVHDELVFEVKTAKVDACVEEITRIMVEAGELSVPLEIHVGVGPNWDAAH